MAFILQNIPLDINEKTSALLTESKRLESFG
jgi:hypothetical protein